MKLTKEAAATHYCPCHGCQSQHHDIDLDHDIELYHLDQLRQGHNSHHYHHKLIKRRRSNSLPSWAHPLSFPFNPSMCGKGQGHTHFLRASERRVSFVQVELSSSSEETGIGDYRHRSQYQGQPRPRRRSSCSVTAAASLGRCGSWRKQSTRRGRWRKGEDVDVDMDDDEDDDKACDTVDFALETSLHGLKYICQPERHIVERVFWMLAFGIGLTMAGWLISDVWINYLRAPVVVTFEPFETTIDKIPFPAITICNMNKVLKSKAEEFIRLAQGPEDDQGTIEARKNVYYLDHVCSSSKSFSQKFNYSSKRGQVDPSLLARTRVEDGDDEQRDVATFLQIASQPCEEMLLLCAWQDTTFNCSDLFKPIETDFGKCCSFNMIPHLLLYKNMNEGKYDAKEVAGWSKWDIVQNGLLVDDDDHLGDHTHSTTTTPTSSSTHHYPKPMPFPRRQKRAGKSSGLSVLLNPDLEEYFCTSSDSFGFQLVKHLPIDNPKVVDFGIAIRPNSEVFMGIKPEITMADPDIYNFKLEKRNCYFYGEFPLSYFKLYTSSNCYDECLANQTFEICGCVSYYMPRDDSRDLCGALSFQCAEYVRKSALQSGIKSRCDFCLPACTELEYFSETTFTPLQDGDAIWIKESGAMATSIAPWAHKNVSIVHIYFASDSSYARVRKELYGLTDLIANTGGLMGLCLGFSGLSLVEVIYFYTLRAWCRSRSRGRRRNQPRSRSRSTSASPRRRRRRWPLAEKFSELLLVRKTRVEEERSRSEIDKQISMSTPTPMVIMKSRNQDKKSLAMEMEEDAKKNVESQPPPPLYCSIVSTATPLSGSTPCRQRPLNYEGVTTPQGQVQNHPNLHPCCGHCRHFHGVDSGCRNDVDICCCQFANSRSPYFHSVSPY